MKKFDYLIVGAGLAGIVLAERISNVLKKSCLIVEKRDHIGGNCYDLVNDAGVLIHKYGPHYFRTNSPRIVDYLSLFTEWSPIEYEIKASIKNSLWHFPINLNTFEQLLGRESSEAEFKDYLERNRVPIEVPKNSEEVIVSQVGWALYEMFFKGYTTKQWNTSPKDLDPSVCARIPIRTNRDNRYLQESFQALPKNGYTSMFTRMIGSNGLVEVRTSESYESVRSQLSVSHTIYTGPIDEYFRWNLGRLPYRSLRFEEESFTQDDLQRAGRSTSHLGLWQPALQVNYPGDEPYTRIVEMKHATRQICKNTTIVREYPLNFDGNNEPYYPMPTKEAAALYERYSAQAENLSNVSFIGRLATYRYYNMDQVVGMALAEFERIRKRSS